MTRITVPWKNQTNTWWNETCVNILEHFGLPGDRYITEITADHMHFDFNDDKDALMCRIMISDKI
jgi:hypothetical protein